MYFFIKPFVIKVKLKIRRITELAQERMREDAAEAVRLHHLEQQKQGQYERYRDMARRQDKSGLSADKERE